VPAYPDGHVPWQSPVQWTVADVAIGGPVECGNPARRERSQEQSLAEEVFPVSVLS